MLKFFKQSFCSSRAASKEGFLPKMQDYLQKSREEIKGMHPFIEPPSLTCALGLDLFKAPVITKEGFVYESAEIKRWIVQNPRDPFTGHPLLLEDLCPFPELCDLIKAFIVKQKAFIKHKKSLHDQAFKMARAHSTDSVPELFICPFSKKIIKEAVISKAGIVFDKQSLVDFPRIMSGNQSLLEKPGPEDYVQFDEFQHQINVFLHYRSINQTSSSARASSK